MLIFENPGVADIRGLTIFGLSAKDDPNSIGRFGTGFKYAVAGILREGGAVEVIAGGEHFKFSLLKDNLRGKDFEQITCNGEPLAFTTHLGEHWEPWWLYRELYCNALDEGGTAYAGLLPEHPKTDYTYVIVKGSHLGQIHNEREHYFILPDEVPVFKSDRFEIYDLNIHGTGGGFYCKGVRVHSAQRSTRYRINLFEASLTEDRTLVEWMVSIYQNRILERVSEMPIRLQEAFIVRDKNNEWLNGFCWPNRRFDSAIELLLGLRKSNAELCLNAQGYLFSHAQPSEVFEEVELSPRQQAMLERACDFLTVAGLPDPRRYPITVMKTLGKRVEGQATGGTILLSEMTFNKGTRYLASTLLEETLHIETGFADETRELQTHLFDLVLTVIENAIGESL